MANANTSLNGYEFGRSPRTQAPFWGGGSEGAEIDDTGTYTDKTWSSKKISDELAEKADADDVYTKAEVDALIEGIPAVDAYTKSETDALLANKADVTSVYTKSQTYTKTEVDNLLSQIPAVDAYTKTETDGLLASKANAADVYTKTETDSLLAGKAGVNSVYTKGQTDRLLSDKANAADVYTKSQTDDLVHGKVDRSELADYAKVTSVYTKSQTYTKTEVDALISGAGGGVEIDDTAVVANKTWSSMKIDDEIYNATSGKANSADVYTKTQTDNMLAGYAKTTAVYTKSQTYTKTEVDNLISQAGGGAEIDDTTVAANKVWSSNKTRAELLKAAGLGYEGYIYTRKSLIRAKISGSATSIRNAMKEQFSADYQYSLSGGTVTVSIMYADGSAGQSYTINLTDIPWNDVAAAEYDTNYPSDNSRWKTIVASEDIFEICIGGNVSGSSGYYYPYIFVRVPKGTYTSSISLSVNLGNNTWAKAGSVAVINGYVSDPTVPLFTKDITTMVTNGMSAMAILDEVFMGTGGVVATFNRDQETFMKFNKMVIECSKVDYNGNTVKGKFTWNIKAVQLSKPYSSSQSMGIQTLMLEYEPYRSDGIKWVFDTATGDMKKITMNIPASNGNVTGSKVTDNSSTLEVVLFNMTGMDFTSWTVKFYQ